MANTVPIQPASVITSNHVHNWNDTLPSGKLRIGQLQYSTRIKAVELETHPSSKSHSTFLTIIGGQENHSRLAFYFVQMTMCPLPREGNDPQLATLWRCDYIATVSLWRPNVPVSVVVIVIVVVVVVVVDIVQKVYFLELERTDHFHCARFGLPRRCHGSQSQPVEEDDSRTRSLLLW